MSDRAPLPPIRFRELADALLAQAATLVPEWLPGGKKSPGTDEYVCGSLAGGEGSSCSVNLKKGKWSDFATGEAGNDLLGLYAAIHELSNAKAAVQVARECALEDVAGLVKQSNGAAVKAAPPRPAPPPPASIRPSDEGWTTVRPVPPHALAPTFKHHYRQPADIQHRAEYRVGEDLHGFVVRFVTSDGGKDTLPYTWCSSARDGTAKWHWRQWDEPRPLYLPGYSLPDGRTVVLVEGEKKADALQQLLDAGAPGVYCVVSWPGGCKAWKKADWAWLRGQTVLLWPDCDAKRAALTVAERKATPDKAAQLVLQQSKPILPEEKQPGWSAMAGIGRHLKEAQQCTVQILPIPQPGEVADGWDCGDAIVTDGWTCEQVLSFFAKAQPLPSVEDDADGPPETAAPSGGNPRDPSGGPEAGDHAVDGADQDSPDGFSDYLLMCARQMKIKVWALQPNRKILCEALRIAPGLEGCLAFDELRDEPCTRKPWPWRQEPAPLVDQDDLRLGDYLEKKYKVRSPSRAALAEAIEVVSDEQRFHPVREWITGLQWDGRSRIEKWLIHVLGLDPSTLKKGFKRYLELVGRYVLLGQVARVMEPGCKFDYSVVLEGLTGVGKSTLVETLVGKQFFSDTHFDIGSGKDGMEQLAGIWAYELSEMTAFRRTDSESVKQFFSTKTDRFRGAYGKYVRSHPRQVVIWCTTNKRQYLYDITGNRRFWPIWIGQRINLVWLAKWREQLFAEAFALYRKGVPIFPSPEDEKLYFLPEQRKRLVETSVQARLFNLLTREGAPGGDGKATAELSQHTAFVTVDQMVMALGTDPGKSTAALETQIRDWLMENGWMSGRETGGQRRRGYARPDVWPPVFEDEDPKDEQPNDAKASAPDASGDGDYESF